MGTVSPFIHQVNNRPVIRQHSQSTVAIKTVVDIYELTTCVQYYSMAEFFLGKLSWCCKEQICMGQSVKEVEWS